MVARRPLLAIALVLLAGCARDAPAPPVGSTREVTLTDADGDGFLERGRGEPLRDRGGRGRGLRVLATFAQISDAHVRDEESPARAPFLDRYGPPFESTFRPHEAMLPQVLAAAVRSLNAQRPQAVVVTGDLADSAQANELDQALAVLDGGGVRPDSGARGYDGVQHRGSPDPLYYRPDIDAPRHPGLLDRAQRPFASPGLAAPWYPVLGNHDLLVAGELAPSPLLAAVAAGEEAVTALPPDYRVSPGADAQTAVRELIAAGLPGRRLRVPSDPARRHLAPRALLQRLARSGAAPAARRAAATRRRLDYAFDVGTRLRGLVLDTIDRGGGSAPLVTRSQLAWLERGLAQARGRAVVVFAHQGLPERALRILDRAPRVAAAVTGHTHRNHIASRRHYWLVSTASLADHPQQARMFRLVRTRTGLALETWMVDHDGRGLAGTARELAYLDAQGGRPQGFAGERLDRNVRLHLQWLLW